MTCHENVTRDAVEGVTLPRPDPTRPDPYMGYVSIHRHSVKAGRGDVWMAAGAARASHADH